MSDSMDIPVYRQKFWTDRNVDEAPIANAKKSVMEVIVMATPLCFRAKYIFFSIGVSPGPSVM